MAIQLRPITPYMMKASCASLKSSALSPVSASQSVGEVPRLTTACAAASSSWKFEENSRKGSSRLGTLGLRLPTLSSGYVLGGKLPSAFGPATIALMSVCTMRVPSIMLSTGSPALPSAIQGSTFG